MKNIQFFSLLWVITFFIMLGACEKVDHKPAQEISETAIGLRSCPVTCPIGDCCCFVELQNSMDIAELELCGTSDGSDGCSGSATGGCASFSGGYHSIELGGINPGRMGFCMGKNEPFWIKNSGDDDIDLYISCQGGIISPQILTITIPKGETWYYETDGDCELDPC